MKNFQRLFLSGEIRNKGFSLIELVIIIGIIGIIAALSTPIYMSYRKKAIQVEAKTNLLNIHKYEIMYYSEYETFSADTNEIGFEAKSAPKYIYSITASENSFTAKARGNVDSDDVEDVWTINDKQIIVHETVD